MINTIIFDLSEVYLTGLKETGKVLGKRYGLPEEKIREIFHGQFLYDFFHGRINEEEFWKAFINETGWEFEVDDLKKMIRDNFSEIEGTREVIEKLKVMGYKLGLLSVHGREWIEHLENKFDYHKLFHSTMYSFEVGVSKPDNKSYELILKKLNAKPEECLFIDDIERNIMAAKRLGISTIHFKDSEQLIKELRNFEINL